MPHILLRFMAIEEEEKLALSRRVATTWVVISMAVAIFIGVVGNGMTHAGTLEELADSETIIVRVASLISEHGVLAALLAGVILAGILAATMSTADSQLLAASSSVSQNLAVEFFKLKISGKKSMLLARSVMVGISLVAAYMARDPGQLGVPGGVLCLGGLRRSLWTGGALRPVLAPLQPLGCSGGHGVRRRHGVYLEVPHCAYGRRLGNL